MNSYLIISGSLAVGFIAGFLTKQWFMSSAKRTTSKKDDDKKTSEANNVSLILTFFCKHTINSTYYCVKFYFYFKFFSIQDKIKI
jgi:hypothetical protein